MSFSNYRQIGWKEKYLALKKNNPKLQYSKILQDHATKDKKYYELIVEWDLAYAQHDRFMDFQDLLKHGTTTQELIEKMPNFVQRWVYKWISSFLAFLYEYSISYDSLTPAIYGFIARSLDDTLYINMHNSTGYHYSKSWDDDSINIFKKETNTLPKRMLQPYYHSCGIMSYVPFPTCRKIMDFLLYSHEFLRMSTGWLSERMGMPDMFLHNKYSKFNNRILDSLPPKENKDDGALI